MTVAYLKTPKTAADWGREIPVSMRSRASVAPTYVFASAGTATVMLGLMFGVAIAVLTGGGIGKQTVADKASANSGATGSNISVVAHRTAAIPPPARIEKSENSTFSLSTVSAAVNPAALEAFSTVQEIPVIRRTKESKPRPFRPETSPTTPAPQSAPEESLTAASTTENPVLSLDLTQKPASFVIEGDVTVADYDVTAGMLETHEGKTFTFKTAAGNSSASTWQDSPVNIHYRCDQGGNCTLIHGGVVVSNARLAI